MFKKPAVAFLFILAFTVSAKEVYYYSNGKKIVLKENFSNQFHSNKTPAYRFLKGGEIRANNFIYIKIPNAKTEEEAKKWCKNNGFELIKQFKYIPDWFLVSFTGDTIKKSAELVENKVVEQAEPSFYIPLELKYFIPDDPFFPNQWHLNNENGAVFGYTGNDHAHVLEAWNVLLAFKGDLGQGIKIAMIDDGFDLDHEDLAGKFLPGYDFTDNDDLPYPGAQDAHGTCCAGVAAAITNNGIGVAGACPDCMIIPIRMNMSPFGGGTLDTIAIESFEWAASAGADIISNSWGPPDGGGFVDMGQPLKDLVKNLTTNLRDGKGIIILFAAGNGSESIESDGFASNPDVFAIGASTAAGKRSSYSDYGMSLDFLAPSNDSSGDGWGMGDSFDGIWTTDNTFGGYNPGQLPGDATGKYVSEFGGTSSSCPLAAGIAGLVLSANPNLSKDEVYEIFRVTADKISMGNVNPMENDYDGNGFSTHYGWGRLNGCEAVKKALETAGHDTLNVVCGTEIDEDNIDKGDNDDDNTQPDEGDTDFNEENGKGDEENKEDDKSQDGDSNVKDEEDGKISMKKNSGCSCSFVNLD